MGMLATLACAAAILSPLSPQDPNDPRFTSVLTKSEKSRLNRLARKWFAAEEALGAESDYRKRAALREAVRKAKEKFWKEWSSRVEKKGDLLAHLGDLLAVFDGAYPYKSRSASGEIKTINPKDKTVPPYSVVVPRGYRPTNKYPAVLTIPAFDEGRGRWTDDKEHYARTWRGSPFASEAIFVMPKLGDDMDLDPVPDPAKSQDEETENRRNFVVLRPFGAVGEEYHLDRTRLILDCGKGSSGYGLRLGTYFPVLFAGIVVRHPVDVTSKIRLDSLAGVPILLIKNEETAAACTKIAETLNAIQPGTVTVIDAKGSYPYPELGEEISKWCATLRRRLYRKRLVMALNHNRFKKSFWVAIDVAEPIENVSLADRPYLKAEANRDANRITVSTKNVSSFVLLLNDALLDLDKEFTVVVNGKAVATEKRSRRFETLIEMMMNRRDPTYLFTTTLPVSVPPPDSTESGGGQGSKPPAK